ncbi:MAG: hypothetical protein R6V40_03175 [Candidatus Moraniibacteriota bacterium]
MYWIIGLIIIVAAVLKLSIFKVPDVHIGLPSSIFVGRFKKELDENGWSTPIGEPYREGYHLKRPWWKIYLFNREVRTRKIKKSEEEEQGREYQIGGESGGTVYVTGVIQYRPSILSLYRLIEVDENAIIEGLDAEVDEFLSQELGKMLSFEEAITRKGQLSKELIGKLTEPTERRLFGNDKPLDHAQLSYGVDILKATIDEIKPTEELRLARDARQKEMYEKDSETTEWVHLMEKAGQLKKILPGLEEREILKAVQVWRKQYNYNYDEIKIDSPDMISSILGTVLKSRKEGSKEQGQGGEQNES